MPTPSIQLTARGLGQQFGRLVLFRDMDFSLHAGTSVAVTGANGSGKSTLLRILLGLLTPTVGEVQLQVEAKAVPRAERVQHMGLVAPYLGVYEALSARENLSFLAKARRVPGADDRIAAVLDRVGLADRADDAVGTYSSGMQQRVKVAAALLHEPPILILDEPSTNLDAPGRSMVRTVQDEHVAQGGLLIVATNHASEAETCDRTVAIGAHQ
ncbi:heme ABC exporter ATP-binding protein CcmA [Longimonas halophila]|uniref:Heme ABC exporter ATP-binding protein CcmA n=1 Tax=Longimonas halophila TaxID=1469170 RepID=A0A2H3NR98_9BACT|nr:heme ABC exporter ATP-binding protein CcmA [Longimonas halophila]PEN09602.1 heme ABC exporter ATP-binding protein CcmA [Longimonas halophila]